METKKFSVAAAFSITTGKLLCDFGDMHELAEWIAGHPIWTHEFASKELSTKLSDAILEQHPELDDCYPATNVNGDNYLDWLSVEVARLGTTQLEFTKGDSERTEGPVESMQRMYPGKKVIVVTPPPA